MTAEVHLGRHIVLFKEVQLEGSISTQRNLGLVLLNNKVEATRKFTIFVALRSL